MRKYLKTQCLGTIAVLGEAHDELIKLTEKKQVDVALSILEQCQQGAIKVGELIDSSEGEGTDEVHLLEEYCEAVWQIGEEIKDGKPFNVRKAEKRLRRILVNVSNGIKNRIPTQKEVVFLPYKASMWDSLESVWKEMDADPDVTAFVIPIPYFDKNPDGTFGQLHYEAGLFPADVPVVGYGSYDLAARHPDAIYIHNPYDEANYVTSVHPDYYSSRLKNMTDELVYIPYFILGDIDPADKGAVEGNEHFVTVPGVVNAHRVIVQSEEWRRVYIDVMTKYAGEQTRRYWQEKIEARVSPKVERVRNLKKEDYELPDEWRSLTDRPDGSRRKIIFYNTGVGPFLQESEAMLEKIKSVFEIFRENADEVTLLWRPHPLMEATLTSMRPLLWEKYKSMVDDYRDSGWGIYDDSPELDRAIAVSDAYYGDWSSVVWLYKETGKPIMIQNCEMGSELSDGAANH